VAKKAGCADAWMSEATRVCHRSTSNHWPYIRSMAKKIIHQRALSLHWTEILQRLSTSARRSPAAGVQKGSAQGCFGMVVEDGNATLATTRSAAGRMRPFHRTSDRPFVMPVSRSTGVALGDGTPGPGRAASTRNLSWKRCAKAAVVTPPCKGLARVRSALFHVPVQTQTLNASFCVSFRVRS